MAYLEELLEYNRRFVAQGRYAPHPAPKMPRKKMAVVSCMDARLTELLPAALGIGDGDAKVIRNAGGIVAEPFGDVMRSLLVAVYMLEVEDILVIGHTDCGVEGLTAAQFLPKMAQRGVCASAIDLCEVDIDQWLRGFAGVADAVRNSMHTIRGHPLLPNDIRVHGFVMDPGTGKLEGVV